MFINKKPLEKLKYQCLEDEYPISINTFLSLRALRDPLLDWEHRGFYYKIR